MADGTQDYAIPADKNPNNLPAELVFPYEQAAYVVLFAEELNFGTSVRTRVDNIQKMLGNPNAVSTVLAAWQGSVSQLTQAVDGSDDGNGLDTANENLKARWNGSARESAVDYVTRLATATRNNRTEIASMATHLNNIGAFVSNAYSQAIVHISNTASDLAQYESAIRKTGINALSVIFTGGAAGTDNAYSAATEAVADFMRETGTIVQSVENYMTKIGGEVDDIITNISKVEIPAAMAPAATDTGGWQPRNPTGPGWGQPS
ncbi:hypothetical protein JK358_37150 [Nocardia sp. 2]|uniref:WXG100 family type VII secretion target n=1 Tax=Nocardia acididurans TaxID=2802282 RepID=A0ABS1MHI0_9NOCA|nr:hypothetical protein [Nocardia acididurans]MBL1080039.1 hypothetical protein [Nocardia acididurans]